MLQGYITFISREIRRDKIGTHAILMCFLFEIQRIKCMLFGTISIQ